MIITRTPFRISYAGGGTDFKNYYSLYSGDVVSTAINKYMYVAINKKFSGNIHIRYSQIEEVNAVNDIRHTMIKAALKMCEIEHGIEIVISSDVPTKGSGLGSSSTLAVGLLNALHLFKGQTLSQEVLAKKACELEIEILKSPIGKQDQYIAAYGGMKRFEFLTDDSVRVHNAYTECNRHRINTLEESSMLFYLGFTRSANTILQEHTDNCNKKTEVLHELKLLSNNFFKWLIDTDCCYDIQNSISTSWNLKKQLSQGYSSSDIEKIFISLYSMGVFGVKLCGAGGGGFMLVVCPKEKQNEVRFLLKDLIELKFKFEKCGTKEIYSDGKLF